MLGTEERFLNVTTDKPDIFERAGYDAKWVIIIASYPSALDYSWRKDDIEIGRSPTDEKYQMERKGATLVLKIMNASIKDGGSYKLVVRHRDFADHIKTLELNLTVLG